MLLRELAFALNTEIHFGDRQYFFKCCRLAAATELVSRLRGQKVKHQDGYILVPETLVA